MQGWRAFYSGDRRFSSADTAWTDLPSEGVLGVVVYLEPPYRHIVVGGDWYYLDDDGTPSRIETHPQWGEWSDPPDVPDDELKRSSSRIDPEEFDAVLDEMGESRTWP